MKTRALLAPAIHVEPRSSRASPTGHAATRTEPPTLIKGPPAPSALATVPKARSKSPVMGPSTWRHPGFRALRGHRGPWAGVDAVAEADARVAAQDAAPGLLQGEPRGRLHGHEPRDVAARAAGEEAQGLPCAFRPHASPRLGEGHREVHGVQVLLQGEGQVQCGAAVVLLSEGERHEAGRAVALRPHQDGQRWLGGRGRRRRRIHGTWRSSRMARKELGALCSQLFGWTPRHAEADGAR